MSKLKNKMHYYYDDEKKIEKSKVEKIKVEKINIEEKKIKIKNEIKIKINEFLSNYSKQRNLDSVFSKWIYSKDNSNPSKTIIEWNNLFKQFLNEK